MSVSLSHPVIGFVSLSHSVIVSVSLSHPVIVSVSGYWQRQRNVRCLIPTLCLSRCLIPSLCLSRCLIPSGYWQQQGIKIRCLIPSLCLSQVTGNKQKQTRCAKLHWLSHSVIVSVSGYWQHKGTNALCKTVHWLSPSVIVFVSGYRQHKGTNCALVVSFSNCVCLRLLATQRNKLFINCLIL